MPRRQTATHAIAWAQTTIDGQTGAPQTALRTGARWSWHGAAMRLDGLEAARDEGPADAERRGRAARMVEQVAGVAAEAGDITLDEDGHALSDGTVTLSDGTTRYAVGLVAQARGGPPLVIFHGEMPPPDTDLQVVSVARHRAGRGIAPQSGAVVPGLLPEARVLTPAGPVTAADLRAGDRVLGRDGAAVPILWRGERAVSAAQLGLRPDLRPIRIEAGALGHGLPHRTVRVAPGQRVEIADRAALALFNARAVLVQAAHLAGLEGIRADPGAGVARYVTLFLPQPGLIQAEGVAFESLHPAGDGLAGLSAEDRAGFAARWEDLARNPARYGPPVRRWLSTGEAAILTSRLG